MAVAWQVKPLAELATLSIFQKVISWLAAPCEDDDSNNDSSPENTDENINPPPDKKRKVFALSLESSHNNTIQTLRAQLDEYLVSSYSQVRQTLLDMFLSTYCYGSKTTAGDFNDSLCLYFFDTVLDKSFKSFSLPGSVIGHANGVISSSGLIIKKCPFPLLNPTKLLEVISTRSPLLERLDLTFSLAKKTEFLDSMFCFQLGKLIHLTSLTLSFKPTDNCLDFFTSLGYSCPQLAILHLSKIPFGTADQLLALMLGSKHILLPPDFSKNAAQLIDIEFSPGSIRPICNSLKELFYVCGEKVLHIAFVLRHFRNLEKLERSECQHSATLNHPLNNTSMWAIQRWHKNRFVENQETGFIITTSTEKLDVTRVDK